MRIAAIFNPPNRHQSERRQRRERTPRHVGFEFNAIRRRQRHRSTVRALLPAAIGLALFTAPAAFAAEPCGNQTCDLGTTCETTEPDCADCEAAYRCVYADCASDSDCADYMVCVAWTEPDCPEQSSGCEPDETDEECAARWDEYEATCDVVEYQQCQLRWEQHCQQASDCGDGFECWPYYSCECPNDQPSDYFRSAIDGCTCEVRDEGYCELLEETCEEDADCPEGMQCLQFNSGPCVVPEGGGEEDCVYTEHVLKCVPRMLGVVVPQSATATLGESGSEAELSSGDQASSAESAEQPAGEEPELSSDLGAEADGTDDALH